MFINPQKYNGSLNKVICHMGPVSFYPNKNLTSGVHKLSFRRMNKHIPFSLCNFSFDLMKSINWQWNSKLQKGKQVTCPSHRTHSRIHRWDRLLKDWTRKVPTSDDTNRHMQAWQVYTLWNQSWREHSKKYKILFVFQAQAHLIYK